MFPFIDHYLSEMSKLTKSKEVGCTFITLMDGKDKTVITNNRAKDAVLLVSGGHYQEL